jgi:hypothetical protein
MYCWIIDKDHLAEQYDCLETDNAAGVCGPEDAPDWMISLLNPKNTHITITNDVRVFKFEMFDDDRERYYSGRLIVDGGEDSTLRDGTATISERACYSPLADFGMPNAGCTYIRYPGHPDMDCE